MKKIIIKEEKNTLSVKDISNNEIIDTFLKGNIEWVNKLYLNETFKNEKFKIKTLKRKLSGYKSQDIKKKRFDHNKFIGYDELLEKIVVSKLLCCYCRCECCLISKKKRDMEQWTLDRINNDIGHFTKNVVISCLKCNLQKRRRCDEHFRFAKQMRIIKHY